MRATGRAHRLPTSVVGLVSSESPAETREEQHASDPLRRSRPHWLGSEIFGFWRASFGPLAPSLYYLPLGERSPASMLRVGHRLGRQLCTAARAARPQIDGDAYSVLGVERDISTSQLKAAYRKMARDWHPDVSKQADASKVFPHITRSYELLSDESQRSMYDFALDHGIVALQSPEKFQDFYANRTYTGHALAWAVRHSGALKHALAAAAACAVCLFQRRRLKPTEEGGPPTSASDFGGLTGAAAGSMCLLSSGVHGFVGARWTLLAAACGALSGRVVMRWAEAQLGRVRMLGMRSVAWVARNNRVVCETAGAAAGAVLFRGGGLRALRGGIFQGGIFGALAGHGVARVACDRSASESPSPSK